jgi:glucose uptake protein GlcU
VTISKKEPGLSLAEIVRALLQSQTEENNFVRHYEETRFKITQMTIALSGALIGVLRFGNSQDHTARLFGIFIIMLGVIGFVISAKYTERADRHASLSRAYRRMASNLIGGVGATTFEKIHDDAAIKHRNARSVTGLLHDFRARLFWMGIHVCMIILGFIVAFS